MANISGDNDIGGLVGQNNGDITRCISGAVVVGNEAVGGMCGQNDHIIFDGYSAATVSGDNSVGGLVGDNKSLGAIISCRSTSSVSQHATDTIHSWYSNNVGGLVGVNWGYIASCHSDGDVLGTHTVGGFVGANSGCIVSCFTTGSVSGGKRIGGFVGVNGSQINMCYSTSIVDWKHEVEGVEEIGGFVSQQYGFVSNSFWDIEVSGQVTSKGALGLSTADMKSLDTYLNAGWDFINEQENGLNDYWQFSPGQYPTLYSDSVDVLNSFEGKGTAEKPFLIRNLKDLSYLWLNPAAHFSLDTSLDLTGVKWTLPVVPWFKGIFNGNNQSISNLNIQGDSGLGLFGVLKSTAEVTNLLLESPDVNGVLSSIGNLAGSNAGIIYSCFTNGKTSGGNHVGALVGSNSGSIHRSSSDANVNGLDSIGGIVGSNYGSLISCYSASTVNGERNVGGLAGSNSNYICSSYSTGPTNGNEYTGGLVGSSFDHSCIVTSFSSSFVKGEDKAGGLVGKNQGSITSCYATNTIKGSVYVGGLVGFNENGHITSCFSQGVVSGTQEHGGLVGYNTNGHINTCYSTTRVEDHIRMNSGGGLVGTNDRGHISTSFWDINTSGQSTSAGGVGLTTAQLKDSNTYLNVGWDFASNSSDGICDFWLMSEGSYPQLNFDVNNVPTMPQGLGTDQSPYLLQNIYDVGTVWFEPMSSYQLISSIDLAEIYWSTAVIPWFSGDFDGNNNTLEGLGITGDSYLGLFGKIYYGDVIRTTITNADITSTGKKSENIGILAGANQGGDISDCYSDGFVTGKDDNIGGLVGLNDGYIERCSSSATVNGDDDIGGLVGWNLREIKESFSDGIVEGDNDIGGLVGQNNDEINKCYSTAAVSGDKSVGGLVGQNDRRDRYQGELKKCYSAGIVSGNTSVGGLVGTNDRSKIKDCFWDIEASGQAFSSGGGLGISTSEMKMTSTFSSWACSPHSWTIQEGLDYPRLKWQDYPGTKIEPINGGGDGGFDSPFLIYTAEDLLLSITPCHTKDAFKLMADIDLDPCLPTSRVFKDSLIKEFEGNFDGNGYVIKNLTILNDSPILCGLFGSLRGTVQNLGIVDANIISLSESSIIGSLAAYNNGVISNCYFTGSISGHGIVGGLVAQNHNFLEGCWSDGEVYGGNCVGGLVGQNYSSSINNSFNTSIVIGQQKVGGIAGSNSAASISMCYSSGAVNGLEQVGGLVGYNLNANIDMCYNRGPVEGDNNIGGLIGKNYFEGTNRIINMSYSTGTVTGQDETGGLIGLNIQKYNGREMILSCFYDFEASGQMDIKNIGSSKTTVEMQTVSTYLDAGWDFIDETINGTDNIWLMPENDYPRLW